MQARRRREETRRPPPPAAATRVDRSGVPADSDPEGVRVGWKSRRKKAAVGGAGGAGSTTPRSQSLRTGEDSRRRRPRRVGPETSYTEVPRKGREKIPLAELGIRDVRPRLRHTEGLLLEIFGEDNAAKTDLLANRMRAELSGEPGVRIGRPQKTAEVRVVRLDESATLAEVATALAAAGGWPAGTVAVGPLRQRGMDLTSAWARLPMAAALALKGAVRVSIGWSCA